MEDNNNKNEVKIEIANAKKSTRTKKSVVEKIKEVNNSQENIKTEVPSDELNDDLSTNELQEDKDKVAAKKKKLKLTDDMILNVESTVFGRLIYVNKKSGEKVVWTNEGEIQQVSVEGIRAMKSNQIAFFNKNWVRLISIADDGYEDYTSEDIYNALMLQKYVEASKLDIEDLIFNKFDKIPMYIQKMGDSFKLQLTIRCNDMIKNGTLDSYSLIRKLEHILETELRETDVD